MRMPTLADDVLDDIVHEIGQMYRGRKKIDALNIFMLSGKEPFTAALRYFSNAKNVCFARGSFNILNEQWGFYGNEMALPLPPVMKTLLASVERIEIYENGINGSSIMEMFVSKKIKQLCIWSRVPVTLLTLFNDCEFDEVVVSDDSNENNEELGAYLTAILSIKSKWHRLILKNANVFEVVEQLSENQLNSFSEKIKYLTISHGLFKHDNKLTADEIERMIRVFNNAFPNVTLIDASLYHHNGYDETAINNILSDPTVFKGLRQSLKGTIRFHTNYQIVDEEYDTQCLLFGPRKSNTPISFIAHDGLVIKAVIGR